MMSKKNIDLMLRLVLEDGFTLRLNAHEGSDNIPSNIVRYMKGEDLFAIFVKGCPYLSGTYEREEAIKFMRGSKSIDLKPDWNGQKF